MAKKVSSIGIPRIRMGTAKVKVVALLRAPSTDTVAKTPPKKSAPPSPINILAGGKLYGRNPIEEPINKKEIKADSHLPC